MKERRPLTDGITPQVDPETARKFIHGEHEDAKPAATQPTPLVSAPLSRSPISTRIRTEFAEALKRASLERQLAKVEPCTVQDILEQALEPWLKTNGYIR